MAPPQKCESKNSLFVSKKKLQTLHCKETCKNCKVIATFVTTSLQSFEEKILITHSMYIMKLLRVFLARRLLNTRRRLRSKLRKTTGDFFCCPALIISEDREAKGQEKCIGTINARCELFSGVFFSRANCFPLFSLNTAAKEDKSDTSFVRR